VSAMIDTIGSLIRYIVIIIFLSTILEMVLPRGVFRRYLRMLVGILLILTLLTPLQKIKSFAPYWETTAFSEGMPEEAALGEILQRGREMYRDNIDLALAEYRYRIFSLLEGELAREFGQKLLRLEVSVEENPESSEFGTLKNIYAEVRDSSAVDADTSQAGAKVEEIKISVEVTGRKEEPAAGEVSENNNGEADGEAVNDKEREINRFIAAYLQLPFDKVKVKILP
jgi:stage III sporulation protein AF